MGVPRVDSWINRYGESTRRMLASVLKLRALTGLIIVGSIFKLNVGSNDDVEGYDRRRKACAQAASSARSNVNSSSALMGLLVIRRYGSRGSCLTAVEVSPVVRTAFNETPNISRNAAIT